MTHAPETGAINRLHFFWRRFLIRVSCKSGTGFIWYWYQIPATDLFQAIRWHAVDWNDDFAFLLQLGYLSVFNTRYNNSDQYDEFMAYVTFSHCLFSAAEIFIPGAYSTINRRQKMERIYGAGFCSVWHGHQSVSAMKALRSWLTIRQWTCYASKIRSHDYTAKAMSCCWWLLTCHHQALQVVPAPVHRPSPTPLRSAQ